MQELHLSKMSFREIKKKQKIMQNIPPTVRMHMWLEVPDGVFFGLGRNFLLQGIEERGSLKKAAENLGMSYRAAWGKLKSTEEILGVQLIEKKGGNRSGFRVTEEGHALMEKFEYWFNSVEREAVRQAQDIFPFDVQIFKNNQNNS